MFLPVWLLPLLKSVLPAVGAIGSSIASVNAQERMNRYNDPRRQLQRLNAAGLPFAAFEAGQAGQQSQLPDFGGIAQAGKFGKLPNKLPASATGRPYDRKSATCWKNCGSRSRHGRE